MRGIKLASENTKNKENREIKESVRFENGSSVLKFKILKDIHHNIGKLAKILQIDV